MVTVNRQMAAMQPILVLKHKLSKVNGQHITLHYLEVCVCVRVCVYVQGSA